MNRRLLYILAITAAAAVSAHSVASKPESSSRRSLASHYGEYDYDAGDYLDYYDYDANDATVTTCPSRRLYGGVDGNDVFNGSGQYGDGDCHAKFGHSWRYAGNGYCCHESCSTFMSGTDCTRCAVNSANGQCYGF